MGHVLVSVLQIFLATYVKFVILNARMMDYHLTVRILVPANVSLAMEENIARFSVVVQLDPME